ncbi:MAG: methylated-DNA--[protein]-cysteine S-methyltransferase [Chlamydiota bacterium]
MHLPILKYYLPSVFSLKLRLYISNLSVEKILLETPSRDGIECLFYANTLPTDPHLARLIQLILSWLKSYLMKKPHAINFPLHNFPSPFNAQVLQTLQQVPFGKTLTYQDLAILIENPKAFRAVGSALNKNPFPLFIPCHRIISKKDALGGFAYPLHLKELLLNFELSDSSLF